MKIQANFLRRRKMQNNLHECKTPGWFFAGDAEAITRCFEKSDGTLWVENGEYRSQVNFCPFCGYEAKVKVN